MSCRAHARSVWRASAWGTLPVKARRVGPHTPHTRTRCECTASAAARGLRTVCGGWARARPPHTIVVARPPRPRHGLHRGEVWGGRHRNGTSYVAGRRRLPRGMRGRSAHGGNDMPGRAPRHETAPRAAMKGDARRASTAARAGATHTRAHTTGKHHARRARAPWRNNTPRADGRSGTERRCSPARLTNSAERKS